MSCSKILDLFYEYTGNDPESEGSMPLYTQAQIWFHTLLCPDCAQQIERFQITRDLVSDEYLGAGLFSTPNFEDSIMAKIEAEEIEAKEIAPAGGLSTRGWVIAGLVIFISLATAYFGLDFKNITAESGNSFLLPMGILIGVVLTVYGAFFIGTHLKELSERVGL
jgi:hypothetical protein